MTIRETWGNGFVTKVELIETDGVTTHTVFTGTDPSQPGAPADFLVSFPLTSYKVAAVKITTSTDHNATAFEEIDSVQLHGSLNPPGTLAGILVTFSGSVDPLTFKPSARACAAGSA